MSHLAQPTGVIFAVFACIGALSGCAVVRTEALRVAPASMDQLSAAELRLVKGETTLEQARRALRARKVTGIVGETISRPGEPRLDVLAADYQEDVHIFVDETYRQSLRLKTRGVPPYGFALRLAESDAGLALLTLYRDPLDMATAVDPVIQPSPPRIEVFVQRQGRFVHRGTQTLRNMTNRHGGMSEPLFVGQDLDDGVMLIARSLSGHVWRRAYFFSLRGADRRQRGPLRVVRVEPLSNVSRCTCVQQFMYEDPVQ